MSLVSLESGCLVFPQLVLHLQPIFDWNVKQLFLYLSAEYATRSNVSPPRTHAHRPKHTMAIDKKLFNTNISNADVIIILTWAETAHKKLISLMCSTLIGANLSLH